MARSKNAWPRRASKVWAAILLATVWSGLNAQEPVPLLPASPARRPVEPGRNVFIVPLRGPAPASLPAAAELPPLEVLAAEPPPPPSAPWAPAAGPAAAPVEPADQRRTLDQFAVRRTTAAVPPTRVDMPPATPERPGPPPAELHRAPILPPIEPERAWVEQLYAVTVNGQKVSDAAIFARETATGRLVVELAEALRWRLVVDQDLVLTLNGQSFYPIDAIPGGELQIDEVDLELALSVPPVALDPVRLAGEGAERPPVVTGFGGFLDYDVQYLAGDGIRSRLDGLFEAGLFGAGGVLTSSLLAADAFSSDGEFVRLETGYSRDFLERRASLRLGDALAVGGAFSRPFRYGGIQWASNFGTDPSFITFPLPTIGGLADNPSVVDVYVDDLQRFSGEVPAGPFQIDQLPVITGAGELQVTVTDLLGRQRVVTQPYYVSARMLRAGLHDYAYEAGLVREDYGLESFEYGDPFVSLTHRYGFSDRFTGEFHLEASPDLQNAAAGGTVAIGRFGTLSGGVGIGLAEDGGTGWLGQLDYEYLGRPFSFGIGTRFASDDWQELGDAENGAQPSRIDQARVGLDLGTLGNLGLFLVHRDERTAEDTLSASASWSSRLGPGSLVLTAAKLIDPSDEAVFFLNYVLPINRRDSAIAGSARDASGTSAEVQYRRNKGDSDLGVDWQVAARAGNDDSSRLAGSLGYDWSKLSTRIDAELGKENSAIRPNLSGSLAVVDGRFDASRRLGRAFGMVYLPDMPDVRVYLENREVGRTDADGRLLLPGLLPYQPNRLRVEVEDLPLDAQVSDPQVDAVPADRSGMTVDFGIRRERQATVRLVVGKGQPLPGGLELAGPAGAVLALVGRDGLAHVTGIGAGEVAVSAAVAGETVTCVLPEDAGDDPMPFLGEVRCR
ncbi:MAG TPA: fimbria/pilus outer membrane usher protein [Geminicoccus sp.]|uniref:fimbria/pilus outer membrane usher protein n=1 Tax=Geminicoccus sp. TaxID=2024832 RepID=UPI002C4239ED|nr:fimbria/pilus outer membrane usher protein [Geminicoccus sp.]HWL67550.1 fimbria/pilus outer membrane usher protein [Geminicoccus sp.]